MRPAGRSASFTPGAVILVSPSLVGKAHDRVGIGDIELVADQRHAERRVQAFEEDASGLGDAVAVGVAQQRDAVGARRRRRRRASCTSFVHPAPDALAVIRLRRRVGFGHQHVAVRQHIDRARMIEPGRERVDGHAVGGDRLAAVRPADGGRDIDRSGSAIFAARAGSGEGPNVCSAAAVSCGSLQAASGSASAPIDIASRSGCA